MTTFPTPATLDGQNITVDWLMNNPIVVHRTLRSLVEQRLVGDKILSGRVDATGSGVVIHGVSESIMATRDPEIITALGEYPLTDDGDEVPARVEVVKNGLGTQIPDELISRNRLDVVQRKMRKLANRIAFNFDSTVLSAVGSAVTQTQEAAAAWSTGGADPLLDTLLSGAQVDELNEGYVVDTILARPTQWARLVAATKIIERAPREGASNPVLTGQLVQFAGLNIIKSTNLPSGVNVMVLDSTQLGSIAYENIGGDFSGRAPEVETHNARIPGRDGWLMRGRKVAAPMIQEPAAAVKVTGV